jgi:hypothetical protein
VISSEIQEILISGLVSTEIMSLLLGPQWRPALQPALRPALRQTTNNEQPNNYPNKAKAISAKLLELNLKNKLE